MHAAVPRCVLCKIGKQGSKITCGLSKISKRASKISKAAILIRQGMDETLFLSLVCAGQGGGAQVVAKWGICKTMPKEWQAAILGIAINRRS